MAISWLAVLQSVPWSEVIANAPKVADGARKLWSTVAKKPAPVEPAAPEAAPPLSVQDRALAELQGQVASLESAVADLHGQMLASSELIKDLADQNTQLIVRVEANRRRALRLGVALAITALVAFTGVALLLAQRAA